ncbi:MAG: hypothetical protein V1839_03155 [archaeon]
MCGQKYAEPFKGGPQYAPTPVTLRQYNLSLPLVSKYPYMAMPNIQRNAMNGYNFQQNKPLQNYQQVNDAFNHNYLNTLKKAKAYSFAPQKDYGLMRKVSALPLTESQAQGLESVIKNDAEILAERMLSPKKKLKPMAQIADYYVNT